MTDEAAKSLADLGRMVAATTDPAGLERLTDDNWVPTEEDLVAGRRLVADALRDER